MLTNPCHHAILFRCTVAEQVAKEKVERVNRQFPSGPIVIRKRMQVGTGEWTCFEGQNNFGLRAPDDQKTWVGVYHHIEKFIEETFYFGFQMTGANADKEIVGRFLDQDSEDRFAFGQAHTARLTMRKTMLEKINSLHLPLLECQ